MSIRTTCVGLTDALLRDWIVAEHFERLADATVAQIAQAYVGVYSARPTSWLAVMARNRNLDRKAVLAMENASDLLRIPGMRRSKFLLPGELAAKVFAATRLPLANHEWRLRDVGLGLDDYRRLLPALVALGTGATLNLSDIGKQLDLPGPQARAVTSVAAYDGALVRVPATNQWSSRWLYSAAPEGLLPGDGVPLDRDQLQRDLAARYLEHYGPVTVDDLAWWLGVSKETARTLLQACAACQIADQMWHSQAGLARLEQFIQSTTSPASAQIRFLPAWDPLVMGYAPGSRQRACLGLERVGGYDSAGNGRPVVLIGGRAVATWNTAAKGSKRSLSVDASTLADQEREAVLEAASLLAQQIGAFHEIQNTTTA
ncbi:MULTISPECIES: crosslink repair DNA glycosylase YcaQ family protein [unclassified Pseudomonas]|uniref:DNA glycosylase AlkZ-like family protein n=1 Tax=unclassified Pseudomonas TaxID=196821 RepID=UPI0008383257|nr:MULTISPECIES: crosslink repair DNA glycosylase YcaQ family protein [unclassified Pseudomonas]QIH08013.1 winged helix DNA-binding domain-containing protein [Pseudomonas sp. BIOMIG1BAC]